MRPEKLARVVALSFVLALGCGTRLVPLTPSAAVLLPQAQQQENVRAAIARAIVARQFVAENEAPGRIIARYERRGTVLRVQIDYSDTQYQITYLDSVGLDQHVDPRTGESMISAQYPRYVRTLSRSIDDELGRPAREAAAEEERERQHQLQLAQQETAREQARLDAQAREAQAQRQAELEAERLRTARAEAEAEARRPVIVTAPNQGMVVGDLAFSGRQRARAGFGVVRRFNQTYTGRAGGQYSAAEMRFPGYCRGYFAEEPSHLVRLDRDTHARVAAESGADTVLALVSEDGSVWCDDDSGGGLDPAIEGDFPAGTYYVWVGTYRPGDDAPYQLRLLEGAPTVAAAPAAPPPPPDCRTMVIEAGHHPSNAVHCSADVEPYCAQALLAAGHHPSNLVFCRNVNSQCAVATLRAGNHPSTLVNCQ